MKKILFVTSECAPFVKAGGLADVSASLPRAIQNCDVRTIFPFYGCISEEHRRLFQTESEYVCGFQGRACPVRLMKTRRNGILHYAIDAPDFFGAPGTPGPYTNILNDNLRFLFFCQAVLEVLPLSDFQPDILHINDWHTCFLPSLLRQRTEPFYQNIRTLLTIHNALCAGVCPFFLKVWKASGLPLSSFLTGPFSWHLRSHPLKAGLMTADYITTVSPAYAEELQTSRYARRLAPFYRRCRDHMSGILNGIDQEVWNPASDALLPRTYDRRTFREGKTPARQKIQEIFHLNRQNDTMILAMVSRFSEQKGSELTCQAARKLLHRNPSLQFIFLGSGEEPYLGQIRDLVRAFPGQAGAMLEFSHTLPSLIYAGADALLMPSLYEPCGLSQLMAMRYGTVPIARATGGLKDTILPFDPDSGTGSGFLFGPFRADSLSDSIQEAFGVWHDDRPAWNELIVRCMTADHSWSQSALQYEQLYTFLTDKRPHP